MSKIVFGYVRVSSLGQCDKDGPRRQRDAIASFVTTHGLELDPAHIYEEKGGVSGTIEGLDRPAFAAMFARIEQLRAQDIEVAGFVCERLDRLARTLHVSEILLAECRKSNLAVYATDQGDTRDMASDGGDPMRVLIRQFMGAMNEYMKSEMVKKMRLARERIRKEKGYCEGRKPFGTQPGEMQCLETIRLFLADKLSPFRIAGQLNAVGFRTRKGGQWSRQYVEHLIKTKSLTKTSE